MSSPSRRVTPLRFDLPDRLRLDSMRQIQQELLILSAVGAFAQITISTQVCKIDVATHHQNGGE
ncbi:MAG: hypothetical protein KME05_17980 [Gloeocapsa sp. UFS-A4-WI-NPMV-4B04]|nr:hypothetical protein [Gloeocapsa sp. UFS-A4-WI-NPMV-4B04]